MIPGIILLYSALFFLKVLLNLKNHWKSSNKILMLSFKSFGMSMLAHNSKTVTSMMDRHMWQSGSGSEAVLFNNRTMAGG